MVPNLSVANALFGKTRQAVLAMLFGNPGRAYYMREIVNRAHSGASQVQRELDRLLRSGLITRERRANQVYFKANSDAAIFRELVGLVVKSFGIGDVLRQALAPVAKKISVAMIYGSVARGEHHATSDVDVLIVGDLLLSDIEGRLDSVETALGRKLSITLMDRKEFVKRRMASDHFLRTILGGPKVFLIGDATNLKANNEPRAR